MRSIRWTRANAVYVPKLDAEHARLFDLLRELSQAAAAEDTRRVQAVYQALLQHVSGHFAHEERLMKSSTYPALDWHKRQHDTVRRRAKEYGDRVEAGDTGAGAELTEFLVSWLRDHTAVHDRMMGAYLRNFERAHSQAAS
jgi:hemerythrin